MPNTVGFEKITITSQTVPSMLGTTLSGLDLASGLITALVTVEDAAVRWRDDGTAADGTQGLGHKVGANGSVYIDTDCRYVGFVNDAAATTSHLQVSYQKP